MTPDARIVRGEAHHAARLTAEQVREIRARASAGATQVALAAAYGVHLTTVNHIVLHRTWRSLLAPSERRPAGSRRTRLTEADVQTIRRRVAGGETRRAVARSFCVSAGRVKDIVCRRTWRHVE